MVCSFTFDRIIIQVLHVCASEARNWKQIVHLKTEIKALIKCIHLHLIA